MSKHEIRVQIVDDHAMVRSGLCRLIEDAPDMTVIVESDSGEQAIRDYVEFEPDVVIMDLNMPGIGGLEAISRIITRTPEARILALSFHESAIVPARALATGACGYVTKGGDAANLIKAIRQLAAGKRYLEPDIAQKILMEGSSRGADVFQKLSKREFEVFLLLAEGYSTAEIAGILHVSPKTIGNQQYSINQKLNLSNKVELTRLAVQFNLIRA